MDEFDILANACCDYEELTDFKFDSLANKFCDSEELIIWKPGYTPHLALYPTTMLNTLHIKTWGWDAPATQKFLVRFARPWLNPPFKISKSAIDASLVSKKVR